MTPGVYAVGLFFLTAGGSNNNEQKARLMLTTGATRLEVS